LLAAPLLATGNVGPSIATSIGSDIGYSVATPTGSTLLKTAPHGSTLSSLQIDSADYTDGDILVTTLSGPTSRRDLGYGEASLSQHFFTLVTTLTHANAHAHAHTHTHTQTQAT
jgi:hypothetical protein